MNTKKILALVLCAVLLVGGSVLGTMAYLTSTTEVVTNTFSVGNVAITLDEAKTNIAGEPVDNEGNVVALSAAPRVTANSYKLLPGHEYEKDPTVHVADGSEDCWLFVKVENQISGIEDTTTISDQMKGNWVLVEGTPNVFAYNETVSAKDNILVFDGFKIKSNVTNETVAGYSGKTITVQAYAVQADGFTTAAAAWAAAPLAAWGSAT